MQKQKTYFNWQKYNSSGLVLLKITKIEMYKIMHWSGARKGWETWQERKKQEAGVVRGQKPREIHITL